MNRILLFRGKAGTGKSFITNKLGKKLNISIIRKDDIFNGLLVDKVDYSLGNRLTYNILANIVQTNINSNCDLILDVGLYHYPYVKEFLSKLDLKDAKLYEFLCICSDDKEWDRRLKLRKDSSLASEVFTSIKEANEHYSKYVVEGNKDEIILDSVEDIETIIDKICNEINKRV